MAAVERYFAVSGAGSGNGTNWDNRAPLFNGSGEWSTIIKNHDFSTDSLVCFVDGGTYSCDEVLAVGSFSTAPTPVAPLYFIAYTDGDFWDDPNPRWNCCEPVWDLSGMPLISASGVQICTLESCLFYGFNIRTAVGNPVVSNLSINRCVIENLGGVATLNNTRGVSGASLLINSYIKMPSQYDYGVQLATGNAPRLVNNIRVEGSGVGAGGNRRGISTGTSAGRYILNNACILNHAGAGVFIGTTGGTTSGAIMSNLTIDSCATGVDIVLTSNSDNRVVSVTNSMITNCTTGISSGRTLFSMHNRLRNTTNLSIPANSPILNDLNYLFSATNDEDYFDYSSGDLRVNPNSSIANTQVGAGSRVNVGGGGGGAYAHAYFG